MTDLLLEAWVGGLIEYSKLQWMLGTGHAWKPGEKLKLLFAGYNGTRNTGSDVRVEEILRQISRIVGPDNAEFTVMTQNFDFTRGYFGDARQVLLPGVFPPFLRREVSRHHGVVACEGSMFKSKFANALTVMMIGSLGIAAAQNKLAIGYGAEAGDMDPLLAKMCRRYCADSFIITRNAQSREVLGRLGVPTEIGNGYGMDFRTVAHRVWPKSPHRESMGRRHSRTGGLPDSSVLVAGESIAGQSCGARVYRRIPQQSLQLHLLPPIGKRRGCCLRALFEWARGRDSAIPP